MELIRNIELALDLTLPPYFSVIEAQTLSDSYYPPFPPSATVIITNFHNEGLANKVKTVLLAVFQPQHTIIIINDPSNKALLTKIEIPLAHFDQISLISPNTIVYVAGMDKETSFEAFHDVVAHLRAADGCPWDRKQTHQTLRSHLLSETYEVLEALDTQSGEGLCEELGDLMLQIVLHAQIAYEMHEFSMVDILRGVHQKIVRRHPHVFGSLQLDNVEGVLQNWELVKAAERDDRQKAEGSNKSKGFIDSVPASLPALVQSQEYQERANRIAYTHPDKNIIYEVIKERLTKLMESSQPLERQFILGDILFYVTSAACQFEIDAESALREANGRFKKLFAK